MHFLTFGPMIKLSEKPFISERYWTPITLVTVVIL